jgi:hypothetical protein
VRDALGGAELGFTDTSPQVRIGDSSCEYTQWRADSALICSVPAKGEAPLSNDIIVTVALYHMGAVHGNSVHTTRVPPAGDCTPPGHVVVHDERDSGRDSCAVGGGARSRTLLQEDVVGAHCPLY